MRQLFILVVIFASGGHVNAQEATKLLKEAQAAAQERKLDKALMACSRVIEIDPKEAAAWQLRGLVNFKLGKIDDSIKDFDKYIELQPDKKAGHWQRGISYYYAGRYDEGRKQFEGYQSVDDSDVENAVWRFMCMVRADGLAKAKTEMLKIGPDSRVPMKQIYDLYLGKLKNEDVIAAAEANKPAADRLNEQLFYAHLYIGINEDLLGHKKEALRHMTVAADRHPIGHYMWDVARVHRDILRRDLKDD